MCASPLYSSPRPVPQMPEPTHSASGSGRARKPDLLCFSHLRWNFVYQRRST
jgi:hypothetical protein